MYHNVQHIIRVASYLYDMSMQVLVLVEVICRTYLVLTWACQRPNTVPKMN